jgi:L-ascorbate metabolism protein UlaG (beta-lactamase superfamily)
MKILKKMLYWTLGIVAVLAVTVLLVLQHPDFGRTPSGERLERIKQSPNYRDGEFQNQIPTAVMTGTENQNVVAAWWDFLFKERPNLVLEEPVKVVRTDLNSLPKDSDCIVWFGHSSYLLQLAGKRILVDPVFDKAVPLSSIFGKTFPGADVYQASDMPEVDYLVITHDHYDHLSRKDVQLLMPKVGHVVCPLGVGEHLEYWDYPAEKITELDWNEDYESTDGFVFHCTPARHFSGRLLKRNQALWASFVVESPTLKVFIGGDSGYGPHFKAIGEKHQDLDVAILENGQYDKNWSQIHTMPHELGKEAIELGAREIITVHHGKYCISNHPWDEPLRNEQQAAKDYHLNLTVLTIGKPQRLTKTEDI